jgi:tRNA-dihydrouridine synthase B
MLKIGALELDRPVLLAPMEEITDRPFRRLARRHGADLVYTEFVSSEALVRSAAKTRAKMTLADDEHPVGIQIYGNREEALAEGARLAEAMGPELIDLNFGCPAKKIACKNGQIGAGAGLLREPELLLSLTRAVVRAVSLPVTVKTRLGWDDSSIIILDLARRLEDLGVAAITLHARTRNQGFKNQADWRWIEQVKRAVSIPVIGNGDIREPEHALRMFSETGCDAVMIGRGAIGNPWIFSRTQACLHGLPDPGPPSIAERIEAYLELLELSVREKGEPRGVLEMRKHLSGYLKGVHRVSALRARLMELTSLASIRAALAEFARFLETGTAPPWMGWEGAGPQVDEPPLLRVAPE